MGTGVRSTMGTAANQRRSIMGTVPIVEGVHTDREVLQPQVVGLFWCSGGSFRRLGRQAVILGISGPQKNPTQGRVGLAPWDSLLPSPRRFHSIRLR
jgi:hypothetical protein